ncbi:MAG: NAD-dependent epimerase/dehydratase family protein [Aggregatilineales bacterium]
MTRRILITGGTGFLGFRVVRALLDENADVTMIGRPGAEDRLGALRERVRWLPGDVWNAGSLRGRARGEQVVIHLVGGVKADPKRGLTFRHLNVLSTRNVAQMAVSDGVPHMLLLSASARMPGVPAGYLESKREAEDYLRKTGLAWTIVRAPPLYAPGQRRNPLYALLTALHWLPLIGWPLTPIAPMSVDVAARGIARLALGIELTQNHVIRPGRLRALGRAPTSMPNVPATAPTDADDPLDNTPFGWLPEKGNDT